MNNKGQLGHGDVRGQEQPKRIEALEHVRVTKVACGGYHTLILTSDNDLYACGANNQGECGTGTTTDVNVPKLIEMPSRRRKNEFFNAFDDDPKPAINDLTKP
jgi:alpha-tubulin suppressor-like RCC1 family protein